MMLASWIQKEIKKKCWGKKYLRETGLSLSKINAHVGVVYIFLREWWGNEVTMLVWGKQSDLMCPHCSCTSLYLSLCSSQTLVKPKILKFARSKKWKKGNVSFYTEEYKASREGNENLDQDIERGHWRERDWKRQTYTIPEILSLPGSKTVSTSTWLH